MKASVVIPAYNAQRTIERCLKSLAVQTFKEKFEVIVVDDGSKDNTVEIVKKFKSVKLIQQQNAGPADARNNGAKLAKGDYLVFLDSDCLVKENWLNEMITPFKGEEIVGVLGKYENRQKELVARFTHLEIESRYEKMAKQKYIDFMGSYSAAYKRQVFEEMKGFDTSFPMASGEDTDLSFRISSKGYKMKFNPKAIVYHFHPISFTKYLKVKFFRALWRTKIYKKHKGKMIKDSYTSQMIKFQTGLFYLILASLSSVVFGFDGILYAGMLFGLLVLSTIPFAVWAFGKDVTVGIVAPFFIILRTVMFGCGLVLGILNETRRSI